jgi:WhiB family redox-sensing transcriptional regulator
MQNFSELLWQEKAICKGLTSKFFAPDIRVKIRASFYREAIEVCKQCPVIKECGEYALKEEIMHGVWGGMTPNDRRAEIHNRIYS